MQGPSLTFGHSSYPPSLWCQEEEARRKARRRNKGRIRELQDLRSELAEKVRAAGV